jgi:hypothetical protein
MGFRFADVVMAEGKLNDSLKIRTRFIIKGVGSDQRKKRRDLRIDQRRTEKEKW